ncbi:glutamate-cysteine ligase family protein [Amycolatopsis jiangsuensis]|uniref:Glutamate--cysteine ligase EgtA n=1 Tax=Amycolatopsis jiangsuensis TaxID=1181879 RepID=A0A840IR69_9PSEU|nr:glutamate-cysteine ligase family protein [Amycolatopsis jiangsuensis]MBB4683668.1 gamma-glutamylcysteine synthetase [Amycolatopsis jiangsuensis]
MTTVHNFPDSPGSASDLAVRVLSDRAAGERYVASVCFKHGPPRLLGVELEFTVHHTGDPARPLDPDVLATALGPHTPRTLRPESPAVPLPAGSPVSLEPGCQVEISALPQASLPALHAAVEADLSHLTALLARAGLELGESGIDAHRPPRRRLRTPRYAAMERRFAPLGEGGITMMCSTAGLQICLDAGEAEQIAPRWAAAHAMGPPLLALFANSRVHQGRDTGHASARWLAVLQTEPVRTRSADADLDPGGAGLDSVGGGPGSAGAGPGSTGAGLGSAGAGWDSAGAGPDPAGTALDPAGAGLDPAGTAVDPAGAGRDSAGADLDPARAWARRMMDTPLMVLPRDRKPWDAPEGLTFADWIAGRGAAAVLPRPTGADLDYHLGTMFTPVRPQGYLELRYLDAQPPGQWLAPVALVTALFADPSTVEEVVRRCAPVAGRWEQAARHGLAAPGMSAVARDLVELGVAALPATGLPEDTITDITTGLRARLDGSRRHER